MHMNEGAFKYFCLVSGISVVSILAADPPAPVPKTTNAPAGGVVTNTASPSITVTNATPEVVTSTNSVISAEEIAAKRAAELKKAKRADAMRKLGVYSVIPDKDPFRLTKPQEEEIKKPEIKERPTYGVPHLAGINRFKGVRAILRINGPRGGKPRYVQLREGEMLQDANGNQFGEVLKIEADKGTVDVKVRGQTFPLEIDRKRSIAASNSSRTRGSSSSRYSRFNASSRGSSSRGSSSRGSSARGASSRGSSGGESSSKSTSPSNPRTRPSSSTTRPKPKGSGGALESIPSRRRKTGAVGESRYEMSAFNESVQRLAVSPLGITAQREIIRGQYSRETPTDLPAEQR